jgi:K+-sensing histidine kinase KdpD
LSWINDVLDISKLDSGDFRLEDEELGVEEVVAYAVRMIKSQADAAEIPSNAVWNRVCPCSGATAGGCVR